MTAPHEAILHKVARWVEYAEEDLRLAEGALRMPDAPYRLVAFHAQQCAEKYLKGYLVLRGVDFPYTHNISVLLEICGPDADWAATLAEADRLSDYAVTARYPGAEAAVTGEEALEAVALARCVREAVRVPLATAGVGF